MHHARIIACFAFMAGLAAAQVTATVGPETAPLGCSIHITFANDTNSNVIYGDGCPYTVFDAAGAVVHSLSCPLFVAVTVPPGQVSEVIPWDQVDNFGNQVPSGVYAVSVTLPTGANSTHLVTIGGVSAGISRLGVNRPGTSRHLALCAPQDPNRLYAMAASLPGPGGIGTCGGVVPLALDPLLLLSLQPNPFFLSFSGMLDGSGRSSDPTLAVPAAPPLTGFTFEVAFVAVDVNQPCLITAVSPALSITIQ